MKKATTYDLIKSLSKSEKRYFKLFSNMQNRSKGNTLLFDLLDKMEVYDEQKLIKKLKTVSTIKNLSIAKKQLYDKLMQALRTYHKPKHPREELFLILGDLRILYGKRQYETCRELIKKGMAIAKENEMSMEIIHLLEWNRKRGIVSQPNRFSIDYSLESYEAIKEELAKLDQLNKYWKVGSSLLFYSNSYSQTRDEKYKKRLEELLEESSLEDLSNTLSPRVLHYCYIVLTFYYHQTKSEKFYEIVELGFNHLKKYPFLIRLGVEGYLVNAYNLLFSYWFLGRYEDVYSLTEELEDIETIYGLKLTAHESIFRFCLIYCHRLLVNIRLKKAKETEDVGEIESFLNENNDKIDEKAKTQLKCNLALYHFVHANYGKTSMYISEIIKDLGKTHKYLDTAVIARLLNLMMQYEMENYEIGLNLLRGQDYYYKDNVKDEFEKILLIFFKKLFQTMRGSKEEQALFFDLQEKVSQNMENKNNRQNWKLLHIDLWVASKLAKLSLKDFLENQNAIA